MRNYATKDLKKIAWRLIADAIRDMAAEDTDQLSVLYRRCYLTRDDLDWLQKYMRQQEAKARVKAEEANTVERYMDFGELFLGDEVNNEDA